MPLRVSTWLSLIADSVERWPRSVKRSPTEVAFFILKRHVPAHMRARVARALPVLPTDDFYRGRPRSSGWRPRTSPTSKTRRANSTLKLRHVLCHPRLEQRSLEC
jgi:hypothetical protein